MSYRLEIPEPCGEDWNLMTPQEKGRYCTVCDKVVVDFSKATKREIITHIKKEGKICGHVPQVFINTNLVDESERQAFGIKGLVATVVNLLALTTTVQAQVKEEPQQEVSPILEKIDQQKQEIENTYIKDSNVIKGVVLSASDSLPLPGAIVMLKETRDEVHSNLYGEFEIKNPKHTTNVLWITYTGFETKEIHISPNSRNNITVYLNEESPIIDGLIIIRKKKKRFWLF
ncbi:MAG: carboxypeptidase-like regulatory domain-containing protein [Flavobacteriaceae bacterium]|jgi:hypothetical protein|nr:carboxypeptidase-like regulatory domain-containing protein [Flavobacteriaceae bacterium]